MRESRGLGCCGSGVSISEIGVVMSVILPTALLSFVL